MSIRDIELLRLLRWCRFIAPSTLGGVFSQTEITNLTGAGFIKRHPGSGAFVLTAKGGSLLDGISTGEELPPMQRGYRETDILRRLSISRLMLTAYRAGFNVFTTEIEELKKTPALFLPFNRRGHGTNPWANARIAAVAGLEDTAYAVHCIRPGIGGLLLSDELAAFTRNTSSLRAASQAFIFCGDSYGELLSELERDEDPNSSRLVSYGGAYRRLRLAAHLLACDDTGALQLRIMSQPGYRGKLTRIALKSKYTPPPADCPMYDALFGGTPFILAADMDLRRIDAAVEAARERHSGPVVLAALEGQAEAVLYARYRDTGTARVFTLTASALSEFLGADGGLYDPSHGPFMTSKGGVIDAPLIKAH